VITGDLRALFSAAMIPTLTAQLGIGVWISRRIASEGDYLVEGRRLGYTLATFSIFAAWFGAKTVIGSSASMLLVASGLLLHNLIVTLAKITDERSKVRVARGGVVFCGGCAVDAAMARLQRKGVRPSVRRADTCSVAKQRTLRASALGGFFPSVTAMFGRPSVQAGRAKRSRT
jgi:hypothetical protein